jgi:hypothetical protein
MTTTLETRPKMLSGDELTRLLAAYLSKVDDTQINDAGCTDEEEPIEADEVIWQLLKPELEEIATLGNKVDECCVPMVVANLTVRASAVAMNEPPQEAITQIAALVAKAREHLRNGIEEAGRDA